MIKKTVSLVCNHCGLEVGWPGTGAVALREALARRFDWVTVTSAVDGQTRDYCSEDCESGARLVTR